VIKAPAISLSGAWQSDPGATLGRLVASLAGALVAVRRELN
jgi:hypothetical protein